MFTGRSVSGAFAQLLPLPVVNTFQSILSEISPSFVICVGWWLCWDCQLLLPSVRLYLIFCTSLVNVKISYFMYVSCKWWCVVFPILISQKTRWVDHQWFPRPSFIPRREHSVITTNGKMFIFFVCLITAKMQILLQNP